MMKRIGVVVCGATIALSLAGVAQAAGSHMVRGYTRSDGTYVAPHVSANPGTYTPPSTVLLPPPVTDHSVSGYTKSDGTYVQPYRATNPDTTRNDNYSTRGNTNPYTLKPGSKPRDGE